MMAAWGSIISSTPFSSFIAADTARLSGTIIKSEQKRVFSLFALLRKLTENFLIKIEIKSAKTLTEQRIRKAYSEYFEMCLLGRHCCNSKVCHDWFHKYFIVHDQLKDNAIFEVKQKWSKAINCIGLCTFCLTDWSCNSKKMHTNQFVNQTLLSFYHTIFSTICFPYIISESSRIDISYSHYKLGFQNSIQSHIVINSKL